MAETLEDRLRRRRLPTHAVPLPVDSDAWARLHREHAEAMWAVEDARARGATDTAQTALDRVQRIEGDIAAAEVDQVVLTALPPDQWEALVGEHPPLPDDVATGAQWNVATFRPALLAASVPPPSPDWDVIAKEGHITPGEYAALFDAALALNLRGLQSAVGKGH